MQVGRPVFDEFLKKNLPGIENEIDLDIWVDGTGIPPDVMEPISTIHDKILSASRDFIVGQILSDEEVNKWQGHEWKLYLESLPKKITPSQVCSLFKLCIISLL